MVEASDKYKDFFPWGHLERFHAIVSNKTSYVLMEKISVVEYDGTTSKGEITYIANDFVEILVNRKSTKKIKFKDIKRIYR